MFMKIVEAVVSFALFMLFWPIILLFFPVYA